MIQSILRALPIPLILALVLGVGIPCAVEAEWTTEVVDAGEYVGWQPSLQLDDQGHPHITYGKFRRSQLKYAHWDGSAWQVEMVAPLGAPCFSLWHSSLILDDQGRPIVCYLDHLYRLTVSRRDDAGWHHELVDGSSTNESYPSLAQDPDGELHIAYWSAGWIKYAHSDGPVWSIEDIAEGSKQADLTLDSLGRPHLTYKCGDNNIWYARRIDQDWEIIPIDGNFYYLPDNPLMILDHADRPWFFYTAHFSYDLHCSWLDGSTLHRETLGQAFFGTFQPALHPSGDPCLCMVDCFDYAWLMRRDGTGWQFAGSPPPFFSSYIDLVFDDGGHPWIAYDGHAGLCLTHELDVATPTPTPPLDLEVRIDMPSWVSPGEDFWVNGELRNPGDAMYELPTFFVLNVADEYWFWPRWSHLGPQGGTIDYDLFDVPTGVTPVEVIPLMTWPDTGDSSASDLRFYGAMLDPDLTEVLGGMAAIWWGYGP